MFDACPEMPLTPLQQSDAYRKALALTQTRTSTLEDGTLILRRKLAGVSLAMLPRAQLSPETLPDLIRTARKRQHLGKDILILNPDTPSKWLGKLGAVPIMTPQYIAELSLTENLRAGLNQKWRNRLVFAERQGLRITRQNMTQKPDQWLLQNNQEQQRERGYSGWSDALTLAYAKANTGDAKLFTAFDGKTPVAAMLFLKHGRSATYHISYTTPEGRALSAHNLLMWQAMIWLGSKGVTHLDLGGVSTEHAAGLARFKLGTGAKLRRLGGTWIWWPTLGRCLRPLSFLDQKLMR
ncbi:GNAT family N-acetyltransferase [Shimia sp. R10_1]|uniref:GNAT family N-acetyltransferase n=1 Tax=Shimia sp. R10_1 TaxID=2821095 RepID=UPI001AD95B42|nr:GNAT family N-acetyltransferase [Shimia sp. R10_1]MBO9474619.1 GNAT family N-acetyltransferase [Shimia sp. R10_1]